MEDETATAFGSSSVEITLARRLSGSPPAAASLCERAESAGFGAPALGVQPVASANYVPRANQMSRTKLCAFDIILLRRAGGRAGLMSGGKS